MFSTSFSCPDLCVICMLLEKSWYFFVIACYFLFLWDVSVLLSIFFTHNSHCAVALIYKGGEVDKIRNKQKQYPLNVLTWVRRISSFVCCWLSCGRKSSEGAPSLGVGLFSPRSIELFAKLTKLCKFFAEAHQAKASYWNHVISIEIHQFSKDFLFFYYCVP